MSYGLTVRQNQALTFIRSYVAEHGVPPDFDSIRVGLGLRSKSGVWNFLAALEKRGAIRRLPNCARSIEIIDHGNASLLETLRPEVRLALLLHCRQTGDDPLSVVNDAVLLHLDETGERTQ